MLLVVLILRVSDGAGHGTICARTGGVGAISVVTGDAGGSSVVAVEAGRRSAGTDLAVNVYVHVRVWGVAKCAGRLRGRHPRA